MKSAYTNALAKINIAKKALGWVKESDLVRGELYRDMLERVTGKRSTAGMNPGQHKLVLDEFKKLGWTPKKRKPVGKDWRAPRIRYIKGLWQQLGALSLLDKPDEEGLTLFCKKLMKGDKLEWATSFELNNILEALKAWLKREVG